MATPTTAPPQPVANGRSTAKDEGNRATLLGLLEKSRRQIALALPRHLTAERMIRMAMTLFGRTPGLQDCAPLSIVACVMQAAELGLELSGPLGQAYMVPRYNKNLRCKEACFQVGYRGLIALALRSGQVDSMPLRVVYTNDVFNYRYGTSQGIEHVPAEEGPPEIEDPSLPYPDNVRAVYAVAYLKHSDRPDFEVMTTAQIEDHRRRYAPDSYKGTISPWNGPGWIEMAKKTPLRRLAKRVPVSIEFQTAAVADELAEAGIGSAAAGLLEAPEVSSGELPAPSRADALADQLGAAPAASPDPVPARPAETIQEPLRQARAEQAVASPAEQTPGEPQAPPSDNPEEWQASDVVINQVQQAVRAAGWRPDRLNEWLRQRGVKGVRKLTYAQADLLLQDLGVAPERQAGQDG